MGHDADAPEHRGRRHPAVLIVNGASPDEETLEKGKEEDVPLLGTPLSAFEVTGKIYSLLLQE